MLDGIADVTNDIEMRKVLHAYSPSEIVAQYNTFFNHWLYRQGVLESSIMHILFYDNSN